MLRRSAAAIAIDEAEAVSKARGARQDPEAPGGPKLVHVSRFDTGARRRETEIDRLSRAGLLNARHEAAAAVYIALLAAVEPGGRDSVEALSASIGGSLPDERHRAQSKLVIARQRVTAINACVRDRIGSQGLEILGYVCAGTTVAAIAVGLALFRTDRRDLGDAKKMHGLVRCAFDALADVVLADSRAPRRFGERVDLGETRTDIEIIYEEPNPPA